MLIVLARYVLSEGHDATVARVLPKNAQATRAEAGCLQFSVYQKIDHPRAFVLYERYTSEEAFQAHRLTPHFEQIIEQQVVPLLWRSVLGHVSNRCPPKFTEGTFGESRHRGKVRKAEADVRAPR